MLPSILVIVCAFGTPPEKCIEGSRYVVGHITGESFGVPFPCRKYHAAHIAPHLEGYPIRIICGVTPGW
jgi:hypothetical protein